MLDLGSTGEIAPRRSAANIDMMNNGGGNRDALAIEKDWTECDEIGQMLTAGIGVVRRSAAVPGASSLVSMWSSMPIALARTATISTESSGALCA